jgi:hypothetical protein
MKHEHYQQLPGGKRFKIRAYGKTALSGLARPESLNPLHAVGVPPLYKVGSLQDADFLLF